MPSHKNPVLSGFNPDPSIVRVGEDFFLVTSTFEYFPGLPIYHSKDVTQWTLIGHALTRRSQLEMRTAEPGSGVWAPTIRFHKGKFYIATCSFTAYTPQQKLRTWPRGFYVSTTDIWRKESWSDPIYFDQPGFDQDLFWDDDEKVYLSTCYRAVDHNPSSPLKGFAVHVSQVDLANGRSLSAPVVVRKSPSGVAEGSHFIKRGAYYYLFTAEGGTESGHSELVFRSRTSPLGPWEPNPRNPLLSSTLQDDVQNTGHADLVEDLKGNWWAVCLAVRPYRSSTPCENGSAFFPSPLGRETFLMKVHWEHDWPVFNNGQKLALEIESKEPEWRDDFSREELALGWYTKNTPLKKEWSLTERRNHLRLWGGPYNLQSLESPTMLLRKQISSRGLWSTHLDFEPSKDSYEAGIVLYWNVYTSASIGVSASRDGSGRREIRHRYPTAIPGESMHSTYPLQHEGPVMLALLCAPTHYKLGYGGGGRTDAAAEAITWLEEIPIRTMTADPPKGMAFTGMMMGVYAFGELEPCLDPADFSSATWSEETVE